MIGRRLLPRYTVLSRATAFLVLIHDYDRVSAGPDRDAEMGRMARLVAGGALARRCAVRTRSIVREWSKARSNAGS